MAKVKCEYCGSFILDTEATCPKCGAVNENHSRVADTTPKTIEELKNWYVARNLPPENVTRFFIGKDVKEPKAFGIFEKHGTFTVYKNKADGSRAVRYKGTDEAYAVNELYLRLKEEILNQKKHNMDRKRSIGNTPAPSVYRPKKRKSLLSKILPLVLALCILPSLLMGLFTKIGMSFLSSSDYGYYVTSADEIFYTSGREYEGKYEWWQYDIAQDGWSIYAKYDKGKQMPEPLDGDDYVFYSSYYDVVQKYSIESKKLPIENAREYIDAGHHKNPMSAYYYYDDELYYFLDDDHSSYGNYDNTGWYIYNTSSSDWEYYCSADDKAKIGEDLWYSQSDYCAGTSYDDMYRADEYLATWTPTDFESTSWYHYYEQNESAYQQHLNDSANDSNDYDNDSDWDWDSNDSWDSGDTDWDSDW